MHPLNPPICLILIVPLFPLKIMHVWRWAKKYECFSVFASFQTFTSLSGWHKFPIKLKLHLSLAKWLGSGCWWKLVKKRSFYLDVGPWSHSRKDLWWVHIVYWLCTVCVSTIESLILFSCRDYYLTCNAFCNTAQLSVLCSHDVNSNWIYWCLSSHCIVFSCFFPVFLHIVTGREADRKQEIRIRDSVTLWHAL